MLNEAVSNPGAPAVTWTGAWRNEAAAEQQARALSGAVGLPLAISRLLVHRGLSTPEAARAFLQPSLEQLHDPHRMLGMGAAVERLRRALSTGEPILIYGDYDVDGTIATVLLKTAAERAAAALGQHADVRYHIPHRIGEGYGIQSARLEAAQLEGVRLVVSVDTGIRAFAAAEGARRLGLDLILTDHHLPDRSGVPDALAVLNPNQPGCLYPCKELCGAAVAFKLAQALLESTARDASERQRLREKTLPSFLKLLAIATIADAVPLTGENRIIASLGLWALRQPAQSGLRALMELAGLDLTQPVSATDVGFRIAPRINAAGRMDIAADVVEMFLTRDIETGRTLASKLHRLNDERRAAEGEALRDIEARLETLAAEPGGLAACLVLDDCGGARTAASGHWHRGVIGILASRVVDRTGRPALVLAHEDGEAYGSGRSVAGFHLLDALTAVHAEQPEPLFSRFGGHAHAVGFSLPSDRVSELRERMERHAAALAEKAGPSTSALTYDLELDLCDLSAEFFSAFKRLEPFGNGNPEPVFVSYGLRLPSAPRFFGEHHMRFSVEDPRNGRRFSAVAWSRRTNWAGLARSLGWTEGTRLDIAYRLRLNQHKDFGGWELEVVDLRAAL